MKRLVGAVIAIALVVGVAGLSKVGGSASAGAWSHASGKVEALAEHREEEGFAKVAADGSARSRRMSSLLDQAVERLSDGAAKDARTRLSEIADRRREIHQELSDAKFDRAAAPAGGSAVDQFMGAIGSSPADKVASLEAELEQLKTDAEAARNSLMASLGEAGVNLAPQQIDGLLMLATGDRIVDMMAAFANLRSIEQELRRVVEASGESATSARRYYGLHATLAEAALWMQQEFVADIDARYLPELDRIEDEASKLVAEAEGLARNAGADRAILEANIAAQQLTLKTAGLYRRELDRQKSAMLSAASKTSREVQVAVNTWRTVKVSTDLVAMTRSADGDFRGLLALELPDLKPFGSVELKAEFERITGRLNSAPAS